MNLLSGIHALRGFPLLEFGQNLGTLLMRTECGKVMGYYF